MFFIKNFKNNQSQVLIITLFILGISMILVFISSFIVNEQIRKLRRIFDSYTAFANAETGIEVSSYFHLKESNLQKFPGFTSFSTSTSGTSSEVFPCNEFYNPSPPKYITCAQTRIKKENEIDTITHSVIESFLTTNILSTRIISNGSYRNISRILIFNFYVR